MSASFTCGGRTDHVEQLVPREAWQLIEMLKAAEKREKPAKARKPPAADPMGLFTPVTDDEVPF